MKKNKRRPFRKLLFLLFCVLVGMFFIVPITGFAFLMASKQDPVDIPPEPAFARDVVLAEEGPASPLAIRAPDPLATRPATVVAPRDPFGMITRPSAQIAGFSNTDPMQRFVNKIRDAEDDEAKQEAIDQAKAALEKHYDKYIDAYEQQVDEMESRLQKLRDQLNKRKDAKDKLVGLKLDMITSQADGIGWPGETDRPNTQRFAPRGRTLWRTKPGTEIPNMPAPNSRPTPTRRGSGANIASPPGRLATSTPEASSTIYSAGDDLSVPRFDSALAQYSGRGSFKRLAGQAKLFADPLNYGNDVTFISYFRNGIKLLNQGKYGEFLDRYLQPDQFRESLKSSTLDEVSKEFADKSADSVLLLFKAAIKKPLKRYGPATKRLTWELETDDGQIKQLHLVRGEGEKWYILLQTPAQDDKRLR